MAVETRSYSALMRVPGFPPLAASILLARTGVTMLSVALVLFILREYHSPTLAGLASFLWIFPGLVISPVAGALLDRYGRVRLTIVDYLVQLVGFALIGGLSLAGHLPAAAILVVVTLLSGTSVLSISAGRTLFPLLVPEHLWERANAVDSQGYVMATLVGPPIAGLLVGVVGGAWTLIICAAVVAAAVAFIARVPEPHTQVPPGSLLRNSWLGLLYVLRKPSLRGLAITVSFFNIAWGIQLIAIPVLVLGRLHEPPVMVGAAYAVGGVTGVVAGLLFGRIDSSGRERHMMAFAIAGQVVTSAMLPWANALWIVLLSQALFGIVTGPFDIALFTLRQRRTDPAWYARAFSVSMSLNYTGNPIGSALAGPLIGWSLAGALWITVLIAVLSIPLPFLTIPADEER